MTTRVRIYAGGDILTKGEYPGKQQWQAPRETPREIAAGPLYLVDLLGRYEQKKLRGKACGTLGQYETAIKHLKAFLRDRDPSTEDLTDKIITDFQFYLVESHGLGVDTVVSYVKKILSLWRFAHRHRIVEAWPEVEMLKIPRHNPIAWTKEELRVLFKVLAAQQGFIGDVAAADYWTALLLTFWDSGERFSAVVSLKVTDINLMSDPGWVTFRAETRKGKLSDRGMPLHSLTVAALKRLLDGRPRRKLVFEAPFGTDMLRDGYKAILRANGLPHDRKHLFHCIRKSVASHWESLGFDATELLDHTMRKVTTDSYLSPQIVKRPRPADSLFRPNEPEGGAV